MMMDDENNYPSIEKRLEGGNAPKKGPNQIDGEDQIHVNFKAPNANGIEVYYETEDGPAVGSLNQVIAILQEEGESELIGNLLEMVKILEEHADDITELTQVESETFNPAYTFDFSVAPYVWDMTALHQQVEGKEGKYQLPQPIEAAGFIPSKNGVGQHGVDASKTSFYGKTFYTSFVMEDAEGDDVCAAGHGSANLRGSFEERNRDLKMERVQAEENYDRGTADIDAEVETMDKRIVEDQKALADTEKSIRDNAEALDASKAELEGATTEDQALNAFQSCRETMKTLGELRIDAKKLNGSIASAKERKTVIIKAKDKALEIYNEYLASSDAEQTQVKEYLDLLGGEKPDGGEVAAA